MKRMLRAVTTAGFVAASAAQVFAVQVSFSVDGVGPTAYPGPVTPPAGAPHSVDGWGYPGDTVELVAGAGSFELVDGATYTLAINTLLWGVDYTYNGTETAWDYPANWPDISHTVIGDRAIHIGSETVTLTQIGLLENTWADDYLSFGDGMTTSVFLSGYRVDITPLGLPVASVDSFNGSIDPPEGGFPQAPRTMYADFTVTAVPDAGATLALMAGALGGLAFIRRRRR